MSDDIVVEVKDLDAGYLPGINIINSANLVARKGELIDLGKNAGLVLLLLLALLIGFRKSRKQTEIVEEFAGRLAQIDVDAELVFQDESLTSVEAERRLGQVKDKGLIDAEAASIILQDYLEEKYWY